MTCEGSEQMLLATTLYDIPESEDLPSLPQKQHISIKLKYCKWFQLGWDVTVRLLIL